MPAPKSLYLHVPFCRHRCGYCNFTLVAGRDDLISAYLQAIEFELKKNPPAQLETVFIGGGTPTHLSIEQLGHLFDLIESQFEFENDVEFSVEGNPRDFDSDKVEFLKSRGVNRISLGVQSFSNRKLSILERDHDRETVSEVADMLRQKIPNFSLDLIFGVKGETPEEWEADLRMCLACKSKHVSTYSLTIEKGTRFWNAENRQQIMHVDDELAVQLYEDGIETLSNSGQTHYEVSNFSQPGFQCRHNINYWQGGEYFGIGPGAARYQNGVRATNHQSTTQYIKRMLDRLDATVESEVINDEQRAREILVFGLRQIAGIDLAEFTESTGRDVFELAGDEISALLDNQLLFLENNRLRLTRSGLLVSDSIWPDLI